MNIGHRPLKGEKYAIQCGRGYLWDIDFFDGDPQRSKPDEIYLISVSSQSHISGKPTKKEISKWDAGETKCAVDNQVINALAKFDIPVGLTLSPSAYLRLCAALSFERGLDSIELIKEYDRLPLRVFRPVSGVKNEVILVEIDVNGSILATYGNW